MPYITCGVVDEYRAQKIKTLAELAEQHVTDGKKFLDAVTAANDGVANARAAVSKAQAELRRQQTLLDEAKQENRNNVRACKAAYDTREAELDVQVATADSAVEEQRKLQIEPDATVKDAQIALRTTEHEIEQTAACIQEDEKLLKYVDRLAKTYEMEASEQ